MIRPFPDTAADKFGITVKQFVVVPNVSRSVSHCMRVFAKKNGHINGAVVRKFFNPLQRKIHFGINVGVVYLALSGSVFGVEQA